MAKIETTANDLQWKSNMITSAAAVSNWETDEKYPSAAAVKNAIAKAVGSVIITSTTDNPSSALDETWELIDKEYRSEFNQIDEVQAWTAEATTAEGQIVRSNHTIWLKMRLDFNTNIAITDESTNTIGLGTVVPTKSGIKSNGSFSYTNEGFVAYGYKPNGDGFVVRCTMHGDGRITIDNIYGSDKTIPTESVLHLTLPIQIAINDMDDAYCDKFYWKRTV